MSDYEVVRNCVLPLDLYYKVEDHLWVRLDDDATATIGMTDVAQTIAGAILHARPRKPGTFRPRGKSLATVESAKWIGPVRAPLSAEVVAVNELVIEDAGLINKRPYGDGWILRLRPTNLEAELPDLVTGEPALAAYRRLMEEEDLDDCIHCEGFEV